MITVRTDEIVNFLEKRTPTILDNLIKANPSHIDILTGDDKLGESDDEKLIQIELCVSASSTIINLCEDHLLVIRRKLETKQSLQLWSQIITTISGASVITSLAIDVKGMAYLGGVLTLVASVVPLVIERFNKTLNKDVALDEKYVKLVECLVESKRIIRYLTVVNKTSVNSNFEAISELINRCNYLCSQIDTLLLI